MPRSGDRRRKHRSHGEGSVYEIVRGGVPTGRWRAQVTKPDGRRVSKTGTRAEVLRWRDAQVKAIREGTFSEPTKATVGEFVQRWLADVIAPARAESTARGYRSLLTGHLLPAYGALPLVKLRPDHLQHLYASSLASGLAPNTVRLLHTIIHGALAQAVRWGYLARNVADAATPPAAPRQEMRFLTAEQARHFLATTAADPLYPLYLLAITTGLRIGEMLALTWQGVDLERGTATIARTLHRWDGKISLGETKNRRVRVVALVPEVVAALRARREAQAPPSAFVFAFSGGLPADDSWVRRRFRAHLKAAGLPPMRFHDLRHTAITLFLSEGAYMKVVQDIAGHSSIATTMRYAHAVPVKQAEAVALVRAALFGGPRAGDGDG